MYGQNAGSLGGRVQAIQQLGAKIHRVQQNKVSDRISNIKDLRCRKGVSVSDKNVDDIFVFLS